MAGDDPRQHLSKEDAKAAKKDAKAKSKAIKAREAARVERAKLRAATELPGVGNLPSGVGITARKRDDQTDLVITGLNDDQVKRLLPEISKEVVIAVTKDESRFRASLMRFAREGLFQTVIKVLAGLIVGYLLIEFGLR